MNLYVISQDVNNNWDTYDSAVVVAETEDAARLIHPSLSDSDARDWAPFDKVAVELIGVADPKLEEGTVVVASFRAG